MEKSRQIPLDASAKDLAELIKSDDAVICQQVAQHPNTSPETLKELFEKYPQEVLNNPVIDLLLLENPNFFKELYNANPDCFNKSLPSFYLDWAANHDDILIRYSIATGIKTPQSILDKLAEDRDLSVVECVARNPNTSTETLAKLARDPIAEIRAAVANSRHTPDYILEKLAEDSVRGIVQCVASHSNTSIETLAKLAQHQDSWIRADVARNKNISLEIMQQLAEGDEKQVLNALLSNPKTPLNILEELAKAMTEERYVALKVSTIAVHPNADPKLKERMYSIYRENLKESTEINFNLVKRAIDMEIKRVGWTKDMGRNHLRKTYGKRSRLHLTDEQLVEFWKYLSDLPTP